VNRRSHEVHPREHTVQTRDGVRLALHEVGGDGPGVLLVHGFAQNRHTFALGALPDAFVRCGARVFYGELRGHGRSQRPERPWDLADHLDEDLPALIRAVAERTGGPVHLGGHSMGGMLGYALLTRDVLLASLVTYCAPAILGATRTAVRAAALLAPVAARGRRVPMHHFLRLVSRPLTKDRAPPGLRGLQRFTSLVTPSAGERAALRGALASADPESPRVARQLARMAVRRRPELLGLDLVDCVRRSPLPVALVVGTHDVFAPPKSVRPLLGPGQAGPRRLVQIPGGSHVDVPLGHHAARLAEELWAFVVRA
jgi:pimeloyl-ACP methyl ester carboxylesterase